MHFFAPVTALLSLSALVSAAPAQARAGSYITPAQLATIAPKSVSCANVTSFPDECRTAAQAAPFLNAAFDTFDTKSVGEIAALVSLIAFETGDFRSNVNHFPGRPGQGTRNLMMFPFVWKYALDIPEVAPKAQAAAPELSISSTNDQLNNASNSTKTAVLDLVLDDKFSWASASWFLTTQCNSTIIAALNTATEAGWETYITQCVGTTVTDDRKAYYTRAITALSGSSY